MISQSINEKAHQPDERHDYRGKGAFALTDAFRRRHFPAHLLRDPVAVALKGHVARRPTVLGASHGFVLDPLVARAIGVLKELDLNVKGRPGRDGEVQADPDGC